jgi:hypothetical protein
MELPVELDTETAVALARRSCAERRSLPDQAEVLIRIGLGLPFPFPEETTATIPPALLIQDDECECECQSA